MRATKVLFDFSHSPDEITLTLNTSKAGLLSRLLPKKRRRTLSHLPPEDRPLLLALADLRALGDQWPGELEIGGDRIRMSHRLAASLTGSTATVLGLPPLVDFILRTDAEGLVGSSSFRLRHEWVKHGQRQVVERNGAILQTSDGPRRLPLWMMEAIDIAQTLKPGAEDSDHWLALARFRQALDPGVQVGTPTQAARASMTDFLSGLNVRVADRFSIAPSDDGSDFDVIPFDGQSLDTADFDAIDGTVSEMASELRDESLTAFQRRFRERGSLPAYRIGAGEYLVIDQSAAPALDLMAEMQRAPTAERAAFIRNPRARITEAVENALRDRGHLDGLSAEAEEEAVEKAAGPLFVETREFSERVTGIKVFEKRADGPEHGSGTTWLPETFERRLAETLSSLSSSELLNLRSRVEAAIEAGDPDIEFADGSLPARPQALEVINAYLARHEKPANEVPDEEAAAAQPSGPIVLDTIVNFDDLQWAAHLRPRRATHICHQSDLIRTPLKHHQVESLDWQIAAWSAGLPGVLNADEQGLGKTLQTIAFLTWLKADMAQASGGARGPVLIVAPTSLLENWEQEVARHLKEPGLGHLIRLYGSATSARKLAGASGRDVETGESKLDLGFLHEAIDEGRAHRFWLLTTYTTLTNYQHSLARIPLSAAVFDEIQALKNPDSLRAHAARSINADFRIGLTGTPIENSTTDLWAIMDQLAPGSLDSLKDFRQRYDAPEQANMSDLYYRVFGPRADAPPLALRRLKAMVARDLPEKTRRLHPRAMPPRQALVYEDARLKLANGGPGAALKMLHHIRTVSVHPALDEETPDADFIAASARVDATFDILKEIRRRQERALVFIEHRQMQYRFIELVRTEFKLDRVDLINGDTPISRRQAIVDRFQRHQENEGFDLLVLGPKAAGTGLTLTAATHVIHLSRWWNPAVEEQCNDRVHRLGQTRPVTVHVPMAVHPGYRENSFDCLLHSLMQRKRRLASSALWPMGDTNSDAHELQRMLSVEQGDSNANPLEAAILSMFKRDQQSDPEFLPDGSVVFM